MSKTSNILFMLQLLSNKKKYRIQELCTYLEVQPRMIRVYKDDLEKAGIYIDTIRGPYGGYILNQTVSIPKLHIHPKEIELLDKALLKLEDTELTENLRPLQKKLHHFHLLSPPKMEEHEIGLYNKINRAILQKQKIQIEYYSYHKGYTTRIIHPYDLFLFQSGWGVAAYCETKKDIRHFELKRIKKLEIRNECYD